jgi:RimJ/RimL family protein N-acetyltransferase
MTARGEDAVNAFGQPIGRPLPDWQPPGYPDGRTLDGRYCRLERLESPDHADRLGLMFTSDVEVQDWTYMPFGPIASPGDTAQWVDRWSAADGFVYYVITDDSGGRALGVAAYLRIKPTAGSIEIGGILFSRSLVRTVAATESMFMLIDHAFGLGYRRCEWKCDALNEASKRAALRLGFRYEGTFQQATLVKGHNRDTAWYAMTDREWPSVRPGFLTWLDEDNFDERGRQRFRLRVRE